MMSKKKSNIKLKVTDKVFVTELSKLSTVNLVIWIIGRSTEFNLILSLEDITLEAWLINPKKHSMRGYSEYPDSFNVMKRVYDMKGRSGWLKGSSSGGFLLTAKARTKYQEILTDVLQENTKELSKNLGDDRSITSIDEAPYKRLVKTPAYIKFTDKRRNEIVETDYLNFFGVNWNQKPAYIDGKIKNVEYIVEHFREKDKTLKDLLDFLEEKFKPTKKFLLK